MLDELLTMMILQQSKRYMGTEKFAKVLSRVMLLAIIMFTPIRNKFFEMLTNSR